MLAVEPEQALAARLAAQHLHERTDPLTAIGDSCGLQETPPGWSAIALHARSDGMPPAGSTVLVGAMRGAPHVVVTAELATFTRALVPACNDGLKALVGSVVAKEVAAAGLTIREAVDQVAGAARDELADAGELGRDDFHQALRERLPDGLLPWCRGCESHHVRPGLWRSLGPLGVTVMTARATYALAPGDAPGLPVPRPEGVEEARADLARRFLRAFGPATHTHLAKWAQTAPAHAKECVALIADETETVRLDGAKRLILSAARGGLESPPAARGVRFLGPHDPYGGQLDRETLIPDPAVRKRIFVPVGRPGIVLRDGGVAGTWASRKKGGRLDVTLAPIGGGDPGGADAEAELRTIARLRGCEDLRIVG